MIFNLLLPFLSAAYFEGVFPELSDQLCPFQKGEVVLYAISADADFHARLSAFGLYGASVEMTASIFFSKFGKRRIVSVIQAFYLYVIRLLSLRTLR